MRNGDPPPCGPRNHCRAVGEPPVNLLESGALWRDFGPGVGENASSDPFQLQYMCPEVGGPKSNNLGANLIGGGRGERRHADRDDTSDARLGCVVVSLASPSQPGPMPMAFPPGETEMDSSSWWPSPAKGVLCKLESTICHRCRLDSPAGWRGELRRVEWQANGHLLCMRGAARVAASRRHEPDRSKVQPRVAQPRVERSSRGSHCPRSSRGSHWLHVVSPQVTDLVPYYLPCTISSSLYHIIFRYPFLLRSLPLPSCL